MTLSAPAPPPGARHAANLAGLRARYRWLRHCNAVAVAEITAIAVGFTLFYYTWTPLLQRAIIAVSLALPAVWLISLSYAERHAVRRRARAVGMVAGFILGVGVVGFELMILISDFDRFWPWALFWLPAGLILLALTLATGQGQQCDERLSPPPDPPAQPDELADYEVQPWDEGGSSAGANKPRR